MIQGLCATIDGSAAKRARHNRSLIATPPSDRPGKYTLPSSGERPMSGVTPNTVKNDGVTLSSATDSGRSSAPLATGIWMVPAVAATPLKPFAESRQSA
jgi:hypothetical protein